MGETRTSGKAWTRMFLADEVESAVVSSAGFKERFGTLAAHPYDKEKPDRTIWWLFQRTSVKWGNWPAYSLGKFFFDRPAGRGVMRVGLHIEKGVHPDNAKAYGSGKGKYFGMTPGWAWFGFVEDLRAGRVADAAAEIAARSGEPVEVTVEPSFPLDEPMVHERFGHHRFAVGEGGALRLIEERPRPDKLPGLGKLTTLHELGERFDRATTDEPWTWINVFVSVAVPYHAEPPIGASPAWNGSTFWNCVLEPLAGWVK